MKDSFGAGGFVCGRNWRFGYKASGDIETLKGICGELGMGVEIVAPVFVEGVAVSSTRVRQRLEEGRVGDVCKLLGRPHRIFGVAAVVVSGREEKGFVVGSIENQIPCRGTYRGFVGIVGEENMDPCLVKIRENQQDTDKKSANNEEAKVNVTLDNTADHEKRYKDAYEVYVEFLDRIE